MGIIKRLFFALRYSRLKPTKMSRQQLRAQRLVLGGRTVSAATWIDKMAEKLPQYSNGRSQHDMMWHWYSKYGLKGLNFYLDYTRYKINKQNKHRQSAVNI